MLKNYDDFEYYHLNVNKEPQQFANNLVCGKPLAELAYKSVKFPNFIEICKIFTCFLDD